jgi:hypothetical protein
MRKPNMIIPITVSWEALTRLGVGPVNSSGGAWGSAISLDAIVVDFEGYTPLHAC